MKCNPLGKVRRTGLKDKKALLFELNIENDKYIFPNTLSDAIRDADEELRELEDAIGVSL